METFHEMRNTLLTFYNEALSRYPLPEEEDLLIDDEELSDDEIERINDVLDSINGMSKIDRENFILLLLLTYYASATCIKAEYDEEEQDIEEEEPDEIIELLNTSEIDFVLDYINSENDIDLFDLVLYVLQEDTTHYTALGITNITDYDEYNAYNELAAFAITNVIGVEPEKIIEKLNQYKLQNDRVQIFDIAGKKGMLLTSKHENSISYNQSLRYIVKENKPCTVVVIIDAVSRKYFTSETSWIWDIDFELLRADCVKEIIIAGKYIHDLSIRFEYAKIDKDKIVEEADLDEMMKKVKESKNENIYVVTCFSDRMKFMDRR